MDGFEIPQLTASEQRICTKIQKQISYCELCQPYDEGEVVWIYGDRTSLFDLLGDFDLKEESLDNIVRNLGCPYCGNDTFNPYSEIGLEDRFDAANRKHLAGAKRKYGKSILSLEDLAKRTPLLISTHPLAKKIFREIDVQMPRQTTAEGDYFWARGTEGDRIFSVGEMLAPPHGKPSEGRYNHGGQNHLYLSQYLEAAISEVSSSLKKGDQICCVAVRLTAPVPHILHLSFEWDDYDPSTSALLVALDSSHVLVKKGSNTENWKPDYFLTRFIMDCAKNAGYNGILYKSVQSFGDNLVIFNPATPLQIIEEPYLVDPKKHRNPLEPDHTLHPDFWSSF